MNRFLTLLIFLCYPSWGSVQVHAQGKTEILASGHQIIDVRLVGATNQIALIQEGHVLFCMQMDKGIPEISRICVLPVGTFVWDFIEPTPGSSALGEVFVQTPDGVESAVIKAGGPAPKFAKVSQPGDLFRGILSAPPAGKRFVWRVGQEAYWVVPTLTGLHCFARDGAGKVTDLGVDVARLTSKQSLGSGMGYRLKARVTVPFFDLDPQAEGAPSLLFRQENQYAIRRFPKGQPLAWGKAPTTEDNLVVEFEHRIPPLAVDFDGDGAKDLIHVDPGSGTTLIYNSKNRATGKGAEPNRVFRITGHVLWRWLADADGDGKKDLFLLEISKLTKIAQVKVMQKRSLPVVLSMRRQLAGGRFQASAKWSDRFDLPCEISLTRNIKRVRFRTPFQLVTTPEEEIRLLGPTEDGKVALYHRVEKSWRPISTHPQLAVENGFLVRPFDAGIWRGATGKEKLIVLQRSPNLTRDRVLMLPLAKNQ